MNSRRHSRERKYIVKANLLFLIRCMLFTIHRLQCKNPGGCRSAVETSAAPGKRINATQDRRQNGHEGVKTCSLSVASHFPIVVCVQVERTIRGGGSLNNLLTTLFVSIA